MRFFESSEDITNRVAAGDEEESIKCFLECGCIDYTERFGAISVPYGYSILLNSDATHFFWVRHFDGSESCIFSDRFYALRSAKQDSISPDQVADI